MASYVCLSCFFYIISFTLETSVLLWSGRMGAGISPASATDLQFVKELSKDQSYHLRLPIPENGLCSHFYVWRLCLSLTKPYPCVENYALLLPTTLLFYSFNKFLRICFIYKLTKNPSKHQHNRDGDDSDKANPHSPTRRTRRGINENCN